MNLDDILYGLWFLPPAFNSEGEKSRQLIAKVISKLPEDIQEKALSELCFICIDGVYGQYEQLYFPLTKKSKKSNGVFLPVVFLNFSSMKRKSEERKMAIIAHEIAHFILNHHNRDGGSKLERETDDLCESWSFKSAYKNHKTYESN